MDLGDADPKGLIRESYRIEGITLGECRSILVDWALSLPVGHPVPEAARVLLATYAPGSPEHPMTSVLAGAQTEPPTPRRRGGRAARQGLAGQT